MKPTILAYLRTRAHGIENKAKREEVVEFVFEKLYPGIPPDRKLKIYESVDRKVRLTMADTPEICSITGGYFIPRDPTEARVSYDYHHKRGMSSLTRAARIRDAHPGVAQRELF